MGMTKSSKLMTTTKILAIFLIICAIPIIVVGSIFINQHITYMNEIKEFVKVELNIDNPELEFYDSEEPTYLEYRVTHYLVKGTNYLISVQHDSNYKIHYIDEDIIYG